MNPRMVPSVLIVALYLAAPAFAQTVTDVKPACGAAGDRVLLLGEDFGDAPTVTVNGEVRATFTSVPGSDATFRTVNGDLDISYPDHLNADLSLKTFNGDMFTDFETEPLAPEPARKTVSDGLTRLEFNKHTRVRIGVGGPRIICDTLNGSILIRKS